MRSALRRFGLAIGYEIGVTAIRISDSIRLALRRFGLAVGYQIGVTAIRVLNHIAIRHTVGDYCLAIDYLTS
ncbi:hypothetical protein NYE80_33250 [Paenibacillus sp. FSL H7-0357]|uniref:hypothetical protein n=1 Tax=unclassified Paenibacillus TaxID=185978 RepID=UPI0012E0473D|nr:hypothetical protein [Paenibacillus sp. FSL H7-0357]